jgi:hypothetical protein
MSRHLPSMLPAACWATAIACLPCHHLCLSAKWLPACYATAFSLRCKDSVIVIVITLFFITVFVTAIIVIHPLALWSSYISLYMGLDLSSILKLFSFSLPSVHINYVILFICFVN